MKEKPILFSTPMVKAILEGRKTQTRRVMKPQMPKEISDSEFASLLEAGRQGVTNPYKPRYEPGDRLWVRETWAADREGRYIYLADPMFDGCSKGDFAWNWKPPIHMPREAARLFLEVKNVRCERVQNISEEDAAAEGFTGSDCCGCGGCAGSDCYDPISDFEILWDSLYAKRGCSWESNPWVWVYEFERREGGKP